MVDPPWAEPDEVVTFRVTAHNPAAVPLPALTLTDTPPDGLVYVPGSGQGFGYELRYKSLVWSAGELTACATITGSFHTRIQGRAVGETITNTVAASSPGWPAPTFAHVALDVVPARGDETRATPEHGGILRSRDDHLLLRVPPGAVARPARLRLLAAHELPASLAQLPLLFGFELRDATTEEAVTTLAAPLTLTWRHTIFNTVAMTLERFVDLFDNLPWQYTGRK